MSKFYLKVASSLPSIILALQQRLMMAFLALQTNSTNIYSESVEKACQGKLFRSLTNYLVDSGHLVGLFALSFQIRYYYSSYFARVSFLQPAFFYLLKNLTAVLKVLAATRAQNYLKPHLIPFTSCLFFILQFFTAQSRSCQQVLESKSANWYCSRGDWVRSLGQR